MLGVYMAFMLHFVVRDSIVEHIENIIDGRPGISLKKNLIISTSFAAVVLVVVITGYGLVESNFEIPAEWIINLRKGCGVNVPIKEAFHYKSFCDTGLCMFILGAYYGIIFD
jgi:hypothetical protein